MAIRRCDPEWVILPLAEVERLVFKMIDWQSTAQVPFRYACCFPLLRLGDQSSVEDESSKSGWSTPLSDDFSQLETMLRQKVPLRCCSTRFLLSYTDWKGQVVEEGSVRKFRTHDAAQKRFLPTRNGAEGESSATVPLKPLSALLH